MGQKINPNGIRIMENFGGGLVVTSSSAKLEGSFSNYWFSDFKYSSLFYQDILIRKNKIRLLMKYYKTRVRFIKGRRRRLKSLLRTNSKYFYILRLPYKITLLSTFYRPAGTGLQRKHTAFLYNIKKNIR